MKRFHLFTSNHLEILVNHLADVLSVPLASPLRPETVVVQSKGMERWISMELARHHGVCANIRFPFPNALLDELFQTLVPDRPEISLFDREVMTWRLMEILPQLRDTPEFEEPGNYLGQTRAGLRVYQLACRIADSFDQYQLFRPEWIFDWEQNRRDDGWQSVLWRKLAHGNESRHRAALGRRLLNALKTSPEALALPERISVFGISTLPRFHMEMFDAISEHREVNLFLMNPCAEYWGDLLSVKERKRLIRRGREKGMAEEELYLGENSGFLDSMGMLGRDFFDLINEFHTDGEDVFLPPDGKNLLGAIQSDILHRTDRPSEHAPVLTPDPDDRSVEVHVCHSPMREIEVLHDNLLAMFEADPALRPADILVMSPDIETCAPFIHAVFDLPPDDPRRIPYSIADRGIRMSSRVVDGFMTLIDLSGSRFSAAEVLAVLEIPAVYKRFGLSEADLERVRQWVRETRIRWGMDAGSRGRFGLPEILENTWQAGLERLLLGYAMTGNGERTFGGILPYDDIEGNEAAILGRLLDFTDRLFSQVNALSRARRLEEWAEALHALLDGFFHSSEETGDEIQLVRDTVNRLGEMEKHAGFGAAVDLQVIRAHLGSRFREDPFGFGFITGGVTFCAMLPMRSIPFRVICLTGMNSEDYPRRSSVPGFDLMARNPRPGDRSCRNDDRYLFLEAILSARQRLYISHVGQSIRDNSVVPPSVLVSELLDYIRQGFAVPEKKIVEDHIVTNHRLQAFSPAYFRDGESRKNIKLFSYSDIHCRAAQQLADTRKQVHRFLEKELPEADKSSKNIDLENLCLFFRNPSRFLLKQRLALRLEIRDDVIAEKEFFDLDTLDRYGIGQELVEKHLGGHDLKAFFALKQKAGQLPHGAMGECVWQTICREIKCFAEKLRLHMAAPALEPLEVDLPVNGFHLTGYIKNIYPEKLVRWRYATIKGKDHLQAWIYHLALNAMARDSKYPGNTLLAGKDGLKRYLPLKSFETLENLVRVYWDGLHAPLPFFPNAAWSYAQTLSKGKPEKEALQAARKSWTDKYGESEDIYFRQCFGDLEPFDGQFAKLANDIFEPIINHQVAA